jgi:hypothetical protein
VTIGTLMFNEAIVLPCEIFSKNIEESRDEQNDKIKLRSTWVMFKYNKSMIQFTIMFYHGWSW